MLSKDDKIQKIHSRVEELGVSAYELAKETGLNESGLSRFLKKEVKNPHKTTIDVLYNFLYNKNIAKSSNIDIQNEIKDITMNAEDLKNFRKKYGYTQGQMAELLGVSKTTILNYEKGSVIPASKTTIFDKIVREHTIKDSTSNFIGKTEKIEVKDFLDVFFLYQEEIEKDERFRIYLEGKEKDAIIRYQHDLLTKAQEKKIL